VRAVLPFVALGVAIGATGCPHHRVADAPVATPPEGIAIAVYAPPGAAGFAVVDDRRQIEVTAGEIAVDRIDPAAALRTLVVEPLDGKPLALGACTRDRIAPGTEALTKLAVRPPPRPGEAATGPQVPPPPDGVLSPVVRCRVDAVPGKHFVRVLHVAPSISFRASHKVVVEGRTATVGSRFALATPAWKTRAQVTMFDGMPGVEVPMRVVGTSTLALDGSVAVVANPDRRAPAQLRTVYDGAIRDRDDSDPREPSWGVESRRTVWVVLDLDIDDLPSGPIEVHAGMPGEPARDVVVTQLDRDQLGPTLQVPLWLDETLHGTRRDDVSTREGPHGRIIVQRIQLMVANASDVPREVWIDERLRPGLRREVRGTPIAPTIVGDTARVKVVVPPRGDERTVFTLRYEL